MSNLAAWGSQSAILIAAGAAAAWLFRLRVPRFRLAYLQALLALCLLLPAIEPWRPEPEATVEVRTGMAQPVASDHHRTYHIPWGETLWIALAAGCAARAIWLAVGLRKLYSWRRSSQPFTLTPAVDRLRAALAPQAEFLTSPTVSGPVTFGFRRPIVVLPPSFAELPADTQEAVACHELLHVRRRDWIATLAEEFVRAALWFHPAIWWLISQIQLAREQTVDNAVVAYTRNREQYLNALLAMAGNPPASDLAPATLFLRKRHLKKRVALLLEEITMTKRRLISFCATSCGVLLAAGWLALHTFPLQASPAPQDQTGPGKLLHSVAPKYPPEALEKKIEGPVMLDIYIDASGHVYSAQPVSGPEELRKAAVDAVLQWHYDPNSMTLPASSQVTVRFQLPGKGPSPQFTLKSIQIEGLSDAARDELLQKLPVHVGETVDGEVMHSIRAAAQAFDEHLMVAVGGNDGSVHIFVAPPPPPPAPSSDQAPSVRIVVGGNVQQAKLLVKVNPTYPPEAKAARIQGIVKLRAVIGKDGSVENLEVLSGHPLLVPAAIDAVRTWRYQTTLLNGDPVEVVTQIDCNFTLLP